MATKSGSMKFLMKTVVLGIRPEKIEAAKKQLSEIHPEVLLFLHKIKRLSVRGKNSCPLLADSMSSISISSEINVIPLRSQGASSCILHLSVQEERGAPEATCSYYLYRRACPVKPENVVDARKDLKEMVISLAFPFGERLKRGTSSVGIFAFLPTAMVTSFPVIIQADFLLASSREAIVMDSKWNLGILGHVPSCFVSALITCMKSAETAEFFTGARVLEFLPVHNSPFKELNRVRESIRAVLMSECTAPYESFCNKQMVFCEPTKAIRIFPEFRKILLRIKGQNVSLSGISSQGKFVLHNSVDHPKYDEVWEFLGVPSASDSYDVYMELLCFLATNWKRFPHYSVNSIPLLKYIAWNGETLSCSVLQIIRESLKVHLVWDAEEHAWLNKWNLEMGCPNDMYFCPDALIASLLGVWRKSALKNYIGSNSISRILQSMPVVDKFGNVTLCTRILVPASMSTWVKLFGSSNPFVRDFAMDNSEMREKQEPFEMMDKEDEANCAEYIELGEGYASATEFAGELTPPRELSNFFVQHAKAVDLPHIVPPDMALQVASTHLTRDQAILLLDWIRNLRAKEYASQTDRSQLKKYDMPARFIKSIRRGEWMKTYSGFSSPMQCYLYDRAENSTLLEIGKTLMVLSAINEQYYQDRISSYKDELIFVGVKIGTENMYQLIIDYLKSLASSPMSRKLAISLLRFIRYSKANDSLDEDLIKTLKNGEMAEDTSRFPGDLSKFTKDAVFLLLKCNPSESLLSNPKWVHLLDIVPLPVIDESYYGDRISSYKAELKAIDCILYDSEWAKVSHFVDLPLIDEAFYGVEIYSFNNELKLLGVVIDFSEGAHFVARGLKLPLEQSLATAESALALLQCVTSLRNSCKPSEQPLPEPLLEKLKREKWLKTHMGYRYPDEALLFNSEWEGHLEEYDGPSLIKVTMGNLVLWEYDGATGGGKWVGSWDCVLHDRDNLFGHCVHALDKYYDKQLLTFLSTAFEVAEFPTLDRYIDLWDGWVGGKQQACPVKLNSFWNYISEHWNPCTEMALKISMTMLPAMDISGKVMLVEKEELFIPDDMHLRMAFTEASEKPLFVWFPQNGLPALSRIYEIYGSLGIRKISESVEFSVNLKSWNLKTA
ncbi:unnamed protein product [Ilex paraguariensis]|uniref:Uncharacterized protein n=1 Tax=Ilex paraguariensis TaxID=185542 RepID=A0ABC8UQK5_9AQUA